MNFVILVHWCRWEIIILFCPISGTVNRAGTGAGLISQGVQKVPFFTSSDSALSNAVILKQSIEAIGTEKE